MLARIVEFSVLNRFMVIFAVLLVAAIGVRAVQHVPIDAVPDVTNVQVQVLTSAPALAPLEVEQLITFPVESALSGIPGVEEVRSLSRFGLSAITVVFEEGTDIYFARQLIAERLVEARELIAEGLGSPEMGPISSGIGEIYQFEIRTDRPCGPGARDTAECHTPMELRTLLDTLVSFQLRSVDGVVEVNAFGGELRTWEIRVDPERLRSYGISLGEVFEAVEANHRSAGGGYLVRGGEQTLIRGDGLVGSLEDLGAIAIETRGEGVPVLLRDLAEVVEAPMIRQGAVTRDGRGEVVIGMALMLLGANSADVARDVRMKIEEISPSLPEGVTIDTFYDRTDLINRTIGTVIRNLIEGGALVIVVLLLLLGNLRGSLLVATLIPLSMLVAFICMQVTGVSGNLMSLGALDFGLVVDGAVVMVESCVRALAEQRVKGAAVDGVVRNAGRSVARPVAFAVGIIMLVYVPILTLQGIEGKMFAPMAMTVLFALGASLVLALTWVPAVGSLIFRGGVSEKETWLYRFAHWVYEPLLGLAFRLRIPLVVLAMVGFLGAAQLARGMGAEFLPQLDEGAIAINVVRLPSVALEESINSSTLLEQALLEHFPDEVVTVISKTGRPEIATDPMGVEMSDIVIMLAPHDEWTRAETTGELVEQMQEVLHTELPGQNFGFSQPIELRTNELISGSRSDVVISISGDDLTELRRVADAVADVARSTPGAGDVDFEKLQGLPSLSVRPNREQIARLGMAVEDVLDVVETLGGRIVGEVAEGQARIPLQVRFPERIRGDIQRIRDLPVSGSTGITVPLSQVASVTIEDGPSQINRANAQRLAKVQVNVRGRDIASFVDEARERVLAEVDVPAGYVIHWGGQFRNLEEATARLMVAVPGALAVIFFMLFAMYRALRPAIVIFLLAPMATTGGIVALYVRDMPLSISAAVGFIALLGIAVLNGVVLVSCIRDLQREGVSLREASQRGALTRLRPVLMTALTTAIGFVPMAISHGAGAEVQRPLATVVIGGVISATILTLVVLPVIYAAIGGVPHDDEPGSDPEAA